MKDRLNRFLKAYGIRILILAISMLFLCTFIGRKEGFHMDEVLAYQLANAEYNPWIVPTQPVGRLAKFMAEHIDGENASETISNVMFIVKDTLSNKGDSILATYKADVYDAPTWISRDAFKDYVQTNRYDDFNLASVYFNVKDDNHPPVHFMLLHLMSSIFKGDMSPVLGCAINLMAVLIVLWLIGLISDMLFQNKYATYAAMLLYGLSVGAVATTIWIRMYAILTLFVVWNLYFHLRNFAEASDDDTSVKTGVKCPKNKGIFIMTILSFWTQYFGLFFILPLAVVTIWVLVKRKEIKRMWAYIRTMVLAAVVGVCVYPFAIGDVLYSSRGTEALSTWGNGIADYVNRLWAFTKVVGTNVAGDIEIFLVLVLVPVIALLYRLIRKKVKLETKWLFAFIPTVVYFLLAAKMSPFYVDRYVMAIFPMTAILLIGLWNVLLGDSQKYRQAILYGTILVSALSVYMMKGEHTYLYTGYEEQVKVAEAYSDYPLVCYYPGLSFYENVMEMERYEKTLLVTDEELSAMTKEHIKEVEDGYVLLIKFPQDNLGEVQLNRAMEVFGGETATLIYEGEPFGDAIYLVTVSNTGAAGNR